MGCGISRKGKAFPRSFYIFRATNQRDKLRSSPGGEEGPLTMPCVQHCSSVTYESSARHRASRWLDRKTTKWMISAVRPEYNPSGHGKEYSYRLAICDFSDFLDRGVLEKKS